MYEYAHLLWTCYDYMMVVDADFLCSCYGDYDAPNMCLTQDVCMFLYDACYDYMICMDVIFLYEGYDHDIYVHMQDGPNTHLM